MVGPPEINSFGVRSKAEAILKSSWLAPLHRARKLTNLRAASPAPGQGQNELLISGVTEPLDELLLLMRQATERGGLGEGVVERPVLDRESVAGHEDAGAAIAARAVHIGRLILA